MLERKRRECTLHPSHGLSALDWNASLSLDAPDFSSLKIQVNSAGTFAELQRAVKSVSLLRGGSSAVSHAVYCEDLTEGMSASLGELAGLVPAVQKHNVDWQGFSICSTYKIETANGKAKVTLQKQSHGCRITREAAERIFASTEFKLESSDSNSFTFIGPNNTKCLPGIIDFRKENALGIGDLYLFGGLSGIKGPAKISLLFLISFTLGMLVRYHPTQWTGLLRGSFPDSALPTIEELRRYLQDEFPVCVLDFLEPSAQPPQAIHL